MSFDHPAYLFPALFIAIAIVALVLAGQRRMTARDLVYSNVAFLNDAIAPRRWIGRAFNTTWIAALALGSPLQGFTCAYRFRHATVRCSFALIHRVQWDLPTFNRRARLRQRLQQRRSLMLRRRGRASVSSPSRAARQSSRHFYPIMKP
jgi:hypothetical protein